MDVTDDMRREADARRHAGGVNGLTADREWEPEVPFDQWWPTVAEQAAVYLVLNTRHKMLGVSKTDGV